MTSIGTQMIQGLINGIKNMAGNVTGAISGVVDGAISKAKSLLGIKSPSRVFKQIGVYTGEGMVLGVESMQSDVQESMAAMVAAPDAARVGFASDVQTQFDGIINANYSAAERDSALISAVASSIANWQPLVQIGTREFRGVMREAERMV